MSKKIAWNGKTQTEAVDILTGNQGMVVSPTKVGYIILTTTEAGLKKKFEAKLRKLNKPAVVLCSSLEQLQEIAETNEEVLNFYKEHWEDDILLGCILPWKTSALKYIPGESKDLVMDNRGTSCFVIKFGIPSEKIVNSLWENENKICFASSANPSGKGNRGLVSGIGERIENYADLIIEADDYVNSIQPSNEVAERYEQGVMVSMVDEKGSLIPMQESSVLVKPNPVFIRKGIYTSYILNSLAKNFNSWEYSHGSYY